MATKAQIDGGIFKTVYDDRWAALYEAIGTVTIERATDIEWDNAAHVWVATLRSTGWEIARGANRAEVVEAEVKYLENRLQTN